MPVQGLVRLRKHLFGRQPDFGTEVAATRAYPVKGVPEVELNWTDPEIDEGSLDPVSPPHREKPDLTASHDFPQLGYNDLPLILCGFFGGGDIPTGGGTAQTWTTEPASTTVDEPDVFTYEFGDDVLTDWYQLRDGIVESATITVPTGLGVVTASVSWRFGHVASTGSTDSPVVGTVPTPDLNVDTEAALLYGKDLAIYIADDVASLAANQIMDAFHSGEIRLGGDIDEKLYANGTQEFDTSAYARATRMIEFEYRFAKTDDTVGTGSESDDWMSDDAVTRYMRWVFTSKVLAQTPSTFNSWTVTAPARYYTQDRGGGRRQLRYRPDRSRLLRSRGPRPRVAVRARQHAYRSRTRNGRVLVMPKEVKIDCACPPDGARHPDGDTVNLRDALGFRPVTAIRNSISLLEDPGNVAEVLAVLTEGYVLYGIESWSLLDEKGPIPVTRAAIEERILARVGIAADVGDAADALYAESVMLPLLNRGRNSSQPTLTVQTSPQSTDSTASSEQPPKPSKRSSITTIQTDATETTSALPDGASSSSPKSASAA